MQSIVFYCDKLISLQITKFTVICCYNLLNKANNSKCVLSIDADNCVAVSVQILYHT